MIIIDYYFNSMFSCFDSILHMWQMDVRTDEIAAAVSHFVWLCMWIVGMR